MILLEKEQIALNLTRFNEQTAYCHDEFVDLVSTIDMALSTPFVVAFVYSAVLQKYKSTSRVVAVLCSHLLFPKPIQNIFGIMRT